MRKSSKILAILFLIVAGGLVYWATQKDEAEINAAVEARVLVATTEREQELDALLAERREALEAEFAGRERMLVDSLTSREAEIQRRLASLDSAMHALDEPVYFRLHADTVEQVLRRMGLDFERSTDDDGNPKLAFRLATYPATLFFHDCEAESCTNLRIYGGFDMDDPPTVEHINEWNRTKRYATAYIRDGGGLSLDNDLVIKGGVTLLAVEDFIINFRNRLSEFARHIDF